MKNDVEDDWVLTPAQFATDDATNISKYENMILEVDRTGFETTIELGPRDGFRYLAAAAVDANNEVLGSTVIYDMSTSKPAALSANIVSVQGPENPPTEELEPEPEPESEPEREADPTPEPEPATEEEDMAGDETGDDADKEKEDESAGQEQTTSTSSFGAIAGSVVVVGGIGSLAMWLLRRRTRKTDIEHSQYKPVRTED